MIAVNRLQQKEKRLALFTGLIERTARFIPLQSGSKSFRAAIEDFENWNDRLQEGESIAVNGACMTALCVGENRFEIDISPESLERTNLKQLKTGSLVNLERSLRLGDRLGGHWVTGHVDALGTIQNISSEGDFFKLQMKYPSSLERYFVEKGSVCVNGVSLTINRTIDDENSIELTIIPHTWTNTNFCELECGSLVNLEIDLIAKHIEKLLLTQETK